MVDRCVCINITFEKLKSMHAEEGLDLEALKDRTGVCSGCAMCEPYIRTMLRTGETCFRPMSPREAAGAMKKP